MEVGHGQHGPAETTSALHHLSPTQAIRFPGPRLHQGQKLWSHRNTNKLHWQTDRLIPSETPRPCSPRWDCSKPAAAAQALSARGAACGQRCPVATRRVEARGTQLKPSCQKGREEQTHPYIPVLRTSQVTISFKLHTAQKFKQRFAAVSVWRFEFQPVWNPGCLFACVILHL